MGTRSHLYQPAVDRAGNVLANVEVTVYKAGTMQLLDQPLFVGDSGNDTQRPNPFVSASGVIDFYLEDPRSVKIGLKAGTVTTTIDNISVMPPAELVVQSDFPFRIGGTPAPGKLMRAVNEAEISWVGIDAIPHQHVITDVTGLSPRLDNMDAVLAGINVGGMQTAIDALEASVTEAEDDILDLQVTQTSHGTSIATINGVNNTQNGRLDNIDYKLASQTRDYRNTTTVSLLWQDANYYFGSPALCGGTFMAPSSGKVLVSVFSKGRVLGGAGGPWLTSFVVKEGTSENGVTFMAEDDNNALWLRGNLEVSGSSSDILVTGLTPGATYSAWHKRRNAGDATHEVNSRRITIKPVLA